MIIIETQRVGNIEGQYLEHPKCVRRIRLFETNNIYAYEEVIAELECKSVETLSVYYEDQEIPILNSSELPLLARLFVAAHNNSIFARYSVRCHLRLFVCN